MRLAEAMRSICPARSGRPIPRSSEASCPGNGSFGGAELELVGEVHRGAERKSVLGTRVPTNVAPQAWILTQLTASRAEDWLVRRRRANGAHEVRNR